MKKETFQEYLARGGKVTFCPPAGPKSKRKRSSSSKTEASSAINEKLIPETLRIALGIKK